MINIFGIAFFYTHNISYIDIFCAQGLKKIRGISPPPIYAYVSISYLKLIIGIAKSM